MPAKVGKGARLKGANFERELAKQLTELTGFTWKRGLGQTRRGGAEVADVLCEEFPGLHVEAKRQHRCNIKAAYRQACGDVEANGAWPIVVTKDDRSDTLVTMKLEHFSELLTAYMLSL